VNPFYLLFNVTAFRRVVGSLLKPGGHKYRLYYFL
jgi:hypothetical protein